MSIRVPAVGAVIRDDEGRLLLIQRGRPPAKGLWSLPGGRLEGDESDVEGLTREVAEETGLRVSVGRLAGVVERDGPGEVIYEIRDYVCTPVGGRLEAGDDADDVGWFTDDQVRTIKTAPGLVEALVEWGLLPPSPPSSRR